jgi:hypothetical protein
VKILPAASLALTLLLTGCPVPVIMDVAKNDVQGQVLDKSTGSPVPDALIVQTISRGGFWSTPATYDIGHAISDNDGTFRITATQQRVLNVSDPDSRPLFRIFAMGYNPAWIFFERDVQPFTTPVRISRSDSVAPRYLIANPCSTVPYTWPTCQLIRKHLNLAAAATREYRPALRLRSPNRGGRLPNFEYPLAVILISV